MTVMLGEGACTAEWLRCLAQDQGFLGSIPECCVKSNGQSLVSMIKAALNH